MRWIVDGMNVIGSRPDGWWLDRAGARRRLIDALGSFRVAEDGAEVSVVFDGALDPTAVEAGTAAGVEVSFAGRARDAADRVIAATVAASPEPEGITVVTSDAALVAAVRSAGAAVVGSSTFRSRIE